MKMVTTELVRELDWNYTDKSKSKMLQIQLSTMISDDGKTRDYVAFTFSKLGEDGKFSDKLMLNLQIPFPQLASKAKEIISRIKALSEGEVLDSDPISFYNRQQRKDSDQLLDLDAYTSKERGTPVICVKMEKKPEGKEAKKWVFYFGQAKNSHRFNKDSVSYTDLKAYDFFFGMQLTFEALAAGTCYHRDYHYKKVLAELNGEKSGSNSSNNSKGGSESYQKKASSEKTSKKSYEEDDEDFPF